MPIKFDYKKIYFVENLTKKLEKFSHTEVITKKDITGIEIRMLPPLIRNNSTARFWPFPGRAKLYCLTIVLSDVASQLTGFLDINTFHSVGDMEYLPINKTLYYWENTTSKQVPGQVHVMSTIIKSKEALRDAAHILVTIKDDPAYHNIVRQLAAFSAEDIPYSILAEITLQIAAVIGGHLGTIEDKPIGTVVNSFTKLHGDWDKMGITPVIIQTRNVDFNYELVVRDQNSSGQHEHSDQCYKFILPKSKT